MEDIKEKRKVLLIDDDRFLAKIVIKDLNDKGLDTHYLSSLTGAKEVIINLRPDIIVLDVELGDGNGIEVASEFKLIAPQTPILFISSHKRGTEISQALDAGGAHYIKKPFDNEELLAYVRKLLPTETTNADSVAIGDYRLYTDTRELFFRTELIKKLSSKEYTLIMLLNRHNGETVDRKTILEAVWGKTQDFDLSLNNFISKLRKLLSKDSRIEIVTITEKGYKLVLVS